MRKFKPSSTSKLVLRLPVVNKRTQKKNMYRALYDYNSTSNGYLTFVKGDEFTLIGEKQGDWLLAQNGFGDIGYIPANYIQRDEAVRS